MPLSAPLDQFADRIIRNGEVRTFIRGLLERGVRQREILAALKPEDRGSDDDREIALWYRRTLCDLTDVSSFDSQAVEANLRQFRQDRSVSPAGDAVRDHLKMK